MRHTLRQGACLRRRRGLWHLISLLVVMLAPLAPVGCSGREPARVSIVALDPPSVAAGAQLLGAAGRGLSVSAGPDLKDRIEQLMASASPDPHLGNPRIVDEGEPADVRISTAPSAQTTSPIARWWSVAAPARRIDLNEVSLAMLLHAARVGPLYVEERDASLVSLLLPEHGGLRPAPAGGLPARLDAEPNALALVPADRMTVQVHALTLDGIDPVRGIGDLERYPLLTRVEIGPIR